MCNQICLYFHNLSMRVIRSKSRQRFSVESLPGCCLKYTFLGLSPRKSNSADWPWDPIINILNKHSREILLQVALWSTIWPMWLTLCLTLFLLVCLFINQGIGFYVTFKILESVNHTLSSRKDTESLRNQEELFY